MNQILDAPAITEQKLEYAGFWIRFVAIIIDGIVLGVVNWVIAFAFFGSVGFNYDFTDPASMFAAGGMYYIISLIIRASYFSVMESSDRQATLGKMAVGIKVGDEKGQRLTLGNAVARWASKIISYLILCIGFIMAGFDARKQGLHDKIAKTVVYYG